MIFKKIYSNYCALLGVVSWGFIIILGLIGILDNKYEILSIASDAIFGKLNGILRGISKFVLFFGGAGIIAGLLVLLIAIILTLLKVELAEGKSRKK